MLFSIAQLFNEEKEKLAVNCIFWKLQGKSLAQENKPGNSTFLPSASHGNGEIVIPRMWAGALQFAPSGDDFSHIRILIL